FFWSWRKSPVLWNVFPILLFTIDEDCAHNLIRPVIESQFGNFAFKNGLKMWILWNFLPAYFCIKHSLKNVFHESFCSLSFLSSSIRLLTSAFVLFDASIAFS